MWGGRIRRTLSEGTPPDPRFTFANERTFLAWIRTSLALIAAGISLEAFLTGLFQSALRHALAVVLVLIGVATSVSALWRWVRSEHALRTGAPLPVPTLAPVLAYGVAAAALVVLIVLLVTR